MERPWGVVAAVTRRTLPAVVVVVDHDRACIQPRVMWTEEPELGHWTADRAGCSLARQSCNVLHFAGGLKR